MPVGLHGRMLLLLCVSISGAAALLTVQQPPVVPALLGQDVLLPCELQESDDEKLLHPPVLYWMFENKQLEFTGRTDSSNKSMPLTNVLWLDGGSYECKVSIRTNKRGSFRLKGNKTKLVIYDTMTFNLINSVDSLLRCEVNVSCGPGFALQVLKDGRPFQPTFDSDGNCTVDRHARALSLTVPLGGRGKYECQVRLKGDLITSSVFHNRPMDVEDLPEPWFLYTSLLLVPVLVLLVLVTAILMHRRLWNS